MRQTLLFSTDFIVIGQSYSLPIKSETQPGWMSGTFARSQGLREICRGCIVRGLPLRIKVRDTPNAGGWAVCMSWCVNRYKDQGSMKFCPHCGARLAVETGRYCQGCGTELPPSTGTLEGAPGPPSRGGPEFPSATPKIDDLGGALLKAGSAAVPSGLSPWFWFGCVLLVSSFAYWLFPVFGSTPTPGHAMAGVDAVVIAGFLTAHIYRRMGRRRFVGFLVGAVVALGFLWCLKISLAGAQRMGFLPLSTAVHPIPADTPLDIQPLGATPALAFPSPQTPSE